MNVENFEWGEKSLGVEIRSRYRKEGYDFAMNKVKKAIDRNRIVKDDGSEVQQVRNQIIEELGIE